ncbi:MAG: pyridoxine 5'-phosphate synthase [Pirellulaceae bacterium]
MREDRRHIQDRDLEVLRKTVQVPLNLECAVDDAMLAIAVAIKPEQVCLVPEKREEVTTEGGLDVAGRLASVQDAVKRLSEAGIAVSLFIDPCRDQVQASKESGAPIVELHTGSYAHSFRSSNEGQEIEKIKRAAVLACQLGLRVDAGHGLTYNNVKAIARMQEIRELNIGHSIVSRSILIGMERAVREMKDILSSVERS